jgi:type II secretory pathway pseudopilin PulG
MFCFKCGASMPDDATICPQCATPVQSIPTAPPPPQAPQAGAPTPASTSAWLNVPPAQTQYPPQQAYPPQAQPYSGQFQPQKTDGGAIASLILGIASIVLCLNIFTGIPAIITGHISYSKIKKSMGRLKGEGMALTGLILGYLSLPTVLIFAAVLIPNLLRARISANESAARSTVRVINTTQVTYSTTYPAQGYAADLATLGPGPTNACSGGGGTVEHACLLDGVLASSRCTSGVWCQKGAYKFTISTTCHAPDPAAQQDQQGQGACAEFVVAATPVSSNMGMHNYCAVSDAVIRSRMGGSMAIPPTAEECQEWAPLSD